MSRFLEIPPSDWLASNELAFAIRDRFPVSPGHTLVITRRLVADWFSATQDERAALLALVDEVKQRLDEELRPDGYNVGFNAGAAAGQTLMHLHVHVIPHYRGDMDDPRGGVRGVIPSKQKYDAEDAHDTTRFEGTGGRCHSARATFDRKVGRGERSHHARPKTMCRDASCNTCDVGSRSRAPAKATVTAYPLGWMRSASRSAIMIRIVSIPISRGTRE